MVYELKKVFDCQNMPDDISEAFWSSIDDCGHIYGNDCYVDWYLEEDAEDTDIYGNDAVKVSKWLLENGANIEDKLVLIRHWW